MKKHYLEKKKKKEMKQEFEVCGMEQTIQETNWYVYMLECNDKSIYTGICKNDINRRMKEHSNGKGSKYVRSRLPFQLMWSKSGFTESKALKEEYRIKQLDSKKKREIWQVRNREKIIGGNDNTNDNKRNIKCLTRPLLSLYDHSDVSIKYVLFFFII